MRRTNFFRLNAYQRFSYLCKFPDPATELKRLCEGIEPEVVFDQTKIEKSPRVLLIGAYEPSDLPAGRFNAPPFGLQRLASFLRAAGINANIFDITTKGKGKLKIFLLKGRYDIIGFSILGPTLPNDIRLTHEVKQLCPTSILVAGGHLTTARPDLLFRSALNYLILGYGEDPLLNLIARFASHRKLASNIPGILRRDKSGHFIGNFARAPTYPDLRVYSFLLDPTIGLDVTYKSTPGLYIKFPKNRINSFRLIAQAFCRNTCSFCSPRNFLKHACGTGTINYISLNAEDRYKLISAILKKLPRVETIFINDDDFFTDKGTAISFFNMIIVAKREGVLRNGNFILSSRIDELDENILRLAKEAGVILINIGVESFAARGLTSLRKNVNSSGKNVMTFIVDSIDMVLNAGIIPSANVIVFYPDVEWSQIYITIKECLNLIEKGGEVNLTRYVRVYHGADILDDRTIPRSSYAEPVFNILSPEESFVFMQETVLLPRSRNMRIFAQKVVLRRAKLEEEIKRRYCWSYRRAPQKVVQLVFLKALFEEALSADYLPRDDVDSFIRQIDLLITKEFHMIGFEIRAEDDPHFPILHLAEEDQKKAITLKKKLEESGLDRRSIKVLFNLITEPFSFLIGDDRFAVVKPYLVYLFYGKEKGHLFHLDILERYILVQIIIQNLLNLTLEDRELVLNTFDVNVESQILNELRLLGNVDIWSGPDSENDHSRKIRYLLEGIQNG